MQQNDVLEQLDALQAAVCDAAGLQSRMCQEAGQPENARIWARRAERWAIRCDCIRDTLTSKEGGT